MSDGSHACSRCNTLCSFTHYRVEPEGGLIVHFTNKVKEKLDEKGLEDHKKIVKEFAQTNYPNARRINVRYATSDFWLPDILYITTQKGGPCGRIEPSRTGAYYRFDQGSQDE